MTDHRQSIIKQQQDAIGISEYALDGNFRGKSGKRADLASDAFWLLTEAMRASQTHLEQSFLFERPTDGDEIDERIALGKRLCTEARDEVRKLL